jgi:clan AA aspartic protease
MTLKRILKPIPQGELSMGLTHVVVRLFNAPSRKTYDADFLVDTGAMDTMAPASELKKIGIQPTGKEEYELANGELVEWEHGSAEIEFMGVIVPIRIIFGPDNSKPLLGVIALETAGFIVDPKHQTLRKLRARPLKRVA